MLLALTRDELTGPQNLYTDEDEGPSSTQYPTNVSNLPGQVGDKFRFHRKKHDEEGVAVTPSTNSGSSENDPSAPRTAEPGQLGRAEKGIVPHEDEDEHLPQMNITTTIVSHIGLIL